MGNHRDYDVGDQNEDGRSPFYERNLPLEDLYYLIVDGDISSFDDALTYPGRVGIHEVKFLTDWNSRRGGGLKITDYMKLGDADLSILDEIAGWDQLNPGKLSVWHEAMVTVLDRSHGWDEGAIIFWVDDPYFAFSFAMLFRGRFPSVETKMVGNACQPDNARQLELL